MRIIELHAENVKKIKAVTIRPDSDLVQITGANAQGKTSVLDSIYWALAGTKDIPGKPVRTGEDKAIVRLDMGEVVVTRRFTAGGGTTVTVEAENGARFPSPQKMLDDLLGSLTFDPLAFSRMDARKQLDTIRSMVVLDIDIDELVRQNAEDFAKRTDLNRQAKALQAQCDAIERTIAPGDSEKTRVDISAATAELQQAGEENALLEKRKANRAATKAAIEQRRKANETILSDIVKLREEIALLEARYNENDAENVRQQKRLDDAEELPEPVDVDAIRQKINDADLINRAVERVEKLAAIKAELEAAQAAADTLTAAMEQRTADRIAAIKRAKMPIDGMEFDETGLLFNGEPFDQASSAEQLRASIAIAMASNPKLRVLRIKDGSLLDEQGLAMVAEMAEENDYQVWLEKVDTTGRVGIVIEDGEVASVDGVKADKLLAIAKKAAKKKD